jgi:cellulose synthase/poly-beta-1,6-N-acetylglucosamine synthase-like glycosyltransferase
MTAPFAVLVVAAVALIGYAYAIYPLLLLIGASVRRPTVRPAVTTWPAITITIPAYNEEVVIGATLERLLALDYPADRRHILVVSDASTDRTDAIVATFASRGVELLRLPSRGGKTAAENAARSRLKGEIIVNTDASISIPPHALKPLIAAFEDPTVGVASGRDVSVGSVTGSANRGESGYVGYEMWVRDLETRTGGIVGASGCFFATRARLHMSMVPEALSRDFGAPLLAREHGYRSVSVNDAICYVPRAASLRREYRRKVRTFTRGMETLYYKRALLNPLRYGAFAWKLLSHKVCRWAVPWAGAAAVLGSLVFAMEDAWARGVVALTAVAGACALGGWYWPASRQMPRFLSLPAYLVSGNVAVLDAAIRALRGELSPIWEPTRRTVSDGPTAEAPAQPSARP